ncbi:uncharacterized protein C5orf34 homolog [Mastacembelus armatus]|uniref:Chromosome 9 C5orf34 homolog n=1 Tax=Mastacembelus armatus TaxID=205130 RepID=A0A3Q3LIN8_9TELE|nr:uncharacterized protein C5orf34 homolog [Mastacembelus armatus]
METNASVSLMVMFEDESVDVQFVNGSRVQLSPCGCEFMLVKAKDPSGHPLQPTERVRQRTRFTISAYKDLIVTALAFRNKYASRPYLPLELIPAAQKKPFFSIDSGVQWPEWSSCEAESRPGGETIIRSEEGRAVLLLSPSGEEFSVEFTCSLSQSPNQHHNMQDFSRGSDNSPDSQQTVSKVSDQDCQSKNGQTKGVHQGRRSSRSETIRSRSCSPRIISTTPLKPEEMYQSTTVIQHHSCYVVAPMWCYPLSLARHQWTACHSTSEDVGAEAPSNSSQADKRTNMPNISIEDRRSCLPQALPLTCPTPHWHRWKFKDPLAKKEHPDQEFLTGLVKVMWCQGVTYRILSGAVSVIEVSPGDGSVIRSNGVLNTYFTHHRPEGQLRQVKEVTYHLNSLPPDITGQAYSICSVLSRASRILTCYNQAKQSLKFPATPSCLQEDGHFLKPVLAEENISSHAPVEQHTNFSVESGLDLVAAELEKIRRFNFLLENSHILRTETGCAELQISSSAELTHEPVNEICIAEALQRTSKAIQDIDDLISATTLT